MAVCTLQGCDSKAASAGIKLTYEGKVLVQNFIDHVSRSHGGAFLTSADFKTKEGAAKDPQASSSSKRSRKSISSSEPETVLTVAEIKNMAIKSAARWVVMDHRPFAIVESMGFRAFCEDMKIPSFSRTAPRSQSGRSAMASPLTRATATA